MADYNLKLSQFHQRVWQNALGLPATIDEYGGIQFGSTSLGELSIFLHEYIPEGLELKLRFFDDRTSPCNDLIQICNSVNRWADAKLTVDVPYSAANASLYLLLAAPGNIPDEGLLRAVVGPAIKKLKEAVDAFAGELAKLKAAQHAVNDHLSSVYRLGMTVDALFESYTSSPEYAQDRLIVTSEMTGDTFPAHIYARQRCTEMCAPGGNAGT